MGLRTPNLRPQPRGLNLTLIEATHCTNPVLTAHYPSTVGTVVVDKGFGYTFFPSGKSFVEASESAIRDASSDVLQKGMVWKEYALRLLAATKNGISLIMSACSSAWRTPTKVIQMKWLLTLWSQCAGVVYFSKTRLQRRFPNKVVDGFDSYILSPFDPGKWFSCCDIPKSCCV